MWLRVLNEPPQPALAYGLGQNIVAGELAV